MPGLITFSNPRGADYVAGSCTRLRFAGQKLFASPKPEPVAVHVGHKWKTAQGEFLRLDVGFRVLIHFERGVTRSETVGPFEHLSSVDGVAYGDRLVMAFCDAQNDDWYSTQFQKHWDAMVATPLS